MVNNPNIVDHDAEQDRPSSSERDLTSVGIDKTRVEIGQLIFNTSQVEEKEKAVKIQGQLIFNTSKVEKEKAVKIQGQTTFNTSKVEKEKIKIQGQTMFKTSKVKLAVPAPEDLQKLDQKISTWLQKVEIDYQVIKSPEQLYGLYCKQNPAVLPLLEKQKEKYMIMFTEGYRLAMQKQEKQLATLESKITHWLTKVDFTNVRSAHDLKARYMQQNAQDRKLMDASPQRFERLFVESYRLAIKKIDREGNVEFKKAAANIRATRLNAKDLENGSYRSADVLTAALLKRWQGIFGAVTDPKSSDALAKVAQDHSNTLHGEWLAHAEGQWKMAQKGIQQLLVVSDDEAQDATFLDAKTFVPTMRKRAEPAFGYIAYDPAMVADAHRFTEKRIADLQKALQRSETKTEESEDAINNSAVADQIVGGNEQAIEAVQDTTNTTLTAKEIVQTAEEVRGGKWASSMSLTEVINGKTWTQELMRDATDVRRADHIGGSGVQRGEIGRNVAKTLIQTTGQLDRGEFQGFKERVQSNDMSDMGHGAGVMTSLFEYAETRKILDRRESTIEEDLNPAVQRILSTDANRVRDAVSRGQLLNTDVDDQRDDEPETDDEEVVVVEDDTPSDGGAVFEKVLHQRKKEKEEQAFERSNLAA